MNELQQWLFENGYCLVVQKPIEYFLKLYPHKEEENE